MLTRVLRARGRIYTRYFIFPLDRDDADSADHFYSQKIFTFSNQHFPFDPNYRFRGAPRYRYTVIILLYYTRCARTTCTYYTIINQAAAAAAAIMTCTRAVNGPGRHGGWQNRLPREENRQLKPADDGSAPPIETGLG